MSRLVIPINGRILWATGDVRLGAELQFLLKDASSNWVPETFRVDTATDLTTFPAFRAQQLNLPMPVHAASGAMHAQTGLEIRSGILCFRVVGMDATEYGTPCLFLGDPNTAPTGIPGAFARKLFQPLALLTRLRFTFDNNTAAGAPYGEMIIEKK